MDIIPETVSPEGLRVRAGIVRRAYENESLARHLELAADRIEELERQLAEGRADANARNEDE